MREVVEAARRTACLDVVGRGIGRQRDHRDVRRCRILPQQQHRLHGARVREGHTHEDRIGPCRTRDLDAAADIARTQQGHARPSADQFLDPLQARRIVLDAQDGVHWQAARQQRRRRIELEPEAAALADGAINPDTTAHQVDQALADHQADAGARLAAGLLSEPVEGFEELRNLRRRQSRAGVRDAHAHSLPGRSSAAHLYASRIAVVLDGVGQQVQQHLLGPPGVGLHLDELLEIWKAQVDARGLRLRLDHGPAVVQHVVQRHRLG